MICIVKLIAVFLFIITTCISCGSVGYYHQSINGHFSLISKREPIDDIVNDSTQDEKLIEQLISAKEIRSFASTALYLPDNDSYLSFVQLDKPYVTWNVFAAPEFSSVLQQGCFPVAGCVQYRGYFNETDAQKYAKKLADMSLDVYVVGVPAYSTLGWFNDPLLSTMLDRGEIVTASYIFHELAHQQLYVKGDTSFNEAFATAVEELGVRSWLLKQQRIDDLNIYEEWLATKNIFSDFIRATRKTFEEIYAQDLPLEVMQQEKKKEVLNVRQRFKYLSKENPQISRYSKWVSGPLNNAQLGAISLYRDLAPAFIHVYELCGEDFERFYQRVEEISGFTVDERKSILIESKNC